MLRKPGHSGADVHDQASRWFAILHSGSATPADRRSFEGWHSASARHREAFERVCQAMDGIDRMRDDPEILALRQAAMRSSVRGRRRWRAAGAAAGITLFVAASVTLFSLGDRITPFASQGDQSEDPASPNMIETAVGEQSTVTLADGSVIDLNTDTRMRVHLSDDTRLVVVMRGQAIFEVARDTARPFVVVAGEHRITALGTRFEVRAEAERTAVTLLEGRVVIDDVRIDPDDEAPASGPSPVELAPGDRFVVLASAAPVIEKADVEKVTGWRDGRVDFEEESLIDVINEINRYSVQKIHVEDADLRSLKISGSFRTGSVDNFLAALAATYPVAVDRRAEQNVLHWKDEP